MALDVGIYRARYLLLNMVRQNHVVVGNSAVNNSLRWFPIEKTISSPVDNFLPAKAINK